MNGSAFEMLILLKSPSTPLSGGLQMGSFRDQARQGM